MNEETELIIPTVRPEICTGCPIPRERWKSEIEGLRSLGLKPRTVKINCCVSYERGEVMIRMESADFDGDGGIIRPIVRTENVAVRCKLAEILNRK